MRAHLIILIALSIQVAAAAAATTGPGSCVILCYHHVDAPAKNEFTVTPEDFEAQLEHLKSGGYNVVPLGAAVDAYRGRGTLPEKAVVITIDDGWRCANVNALPLLKKYGFHATLFIYPQMIGKGGDKSTYEEYKELAKDPLISLGCHSWSHPNLLREGDKVSGEKRDAWLKREYQDSKLELEKKIGVPIKWIAYPYGLYDAQVSQLVREAGYEAALSINAAPNSHKADPMFLNRFMIMKSDGAKAFARKVAALPLALEALSPADGALIARDTRTFSARVVDERVKPETITLIGPGKAKSQYDPETRTVSLTVSKPLTGRVYQLAASARDKDTGQVRRASWLVRVRGAPGGLAKAARPKAAAAKPEVEDEEEAKETEE